MLVIALLVLILPSLAFSASPPIRASSARLAFVKSHPCPATGNPRGACPGYVVDHVVPLCAGGPDRPSNMQWQTIDEAKRKDRQERRQCASLSR